MEKLTVEMVTGNLKPSKYRNRTNKMRISEILIEAQVREGRTAVVGWGRGMGHKGHMYLAQAVIEYAEKIGATPVFFVSETVGADDPLLPKEKLAIYKAVFPKYKNIFHTCNTITAAVGKIHEAGFTDMVLVVGEDQKKSFGFLSRGPASPDRIPVKVMSRQETETSTSHLDGPRATPMREILKNPDASIKQKFELWRDAMPHALGDKKVLTIMKLAAARMGVPIEDNLNEADQPPQSSLYSPLSASTRDMPAPDPKALARKKREAREMKRFMGHTK